MKRVTKLLILSSIVCSSLFANDNLVIHFEKKRVAQNPNIKVNDIKVYYKQDLEIDNWKGYILDLDANIKGKDMKVKDTLFSNDKLIATDLFDIKTGKSFKDSVAPAFNTKSYQISKLIAGNEKAENKIAIFSDPLCPFCMHYVPEVIEYVNKNSETIALYYYSFPLVQIHPASTTLSKIMDITKTKFGNEKFLEAYKTDWTKLFDPSVTDEKTILDAFNKAMQTDIKIEELNKKVTSALEKDTALAEELLINGTPAIYINGIKDPTREKFKSLGKK